MSGLSSCRSLPPTRGETYLEPPTRAFPPPIGGWELLVPNPTWALFKPSWLGIYTRSLREQPCLHHIQALHACTRIQSSAMDVSSWSVQHQACCTKLQAYRACTLRIIRGAGMLQLRLQRLLHSPLPLPHLGGACGQQVHQRERRWRTSGCVKLGSRWPSRCSACSAAAAAASASTSCSLSCLPASTTARRSSGPSLPCGWA